MIKILHVIPSLQMGGAERLVIDICTEINKRKDAEAAMVLFREENLYPELTGNIPVKICRSKVNLHVIKPSQIDLGAFESMVEEFKPHVIHSHLFEAEIITREKLFKGIRYFTHCHDNMPQFRNFSTSTLFSKRRITDFYEKRHLVAKYLKCDNRFIAISPDTKAYFSKVLHRGLTKNISLLQNAINFKLFNSVNRKRELNKVRIINVGSFVKKKNQQFLIDIGEQLKKRGVPTEIKLLGDGPLFNEIKNEISRKGLDEVFSMPGNVNHVENFYAEANVYVHTATYEPFGLVLLEAMASGLPVVALDGKGNRGLVKNGINGFFIREQNVQSFVETILKVTGSEPGYEALNSNAVNFARNFDIQGYVDRLMELYRSK